MASFAAGVSSPDSSFESALSNPDDVPDTPPAEEPPAVPPDSVVIEDEKNVYHIEANTIIIQPLQEPPEDTEPVEEDDPPVEEDDPPSDDPPLEAPAALEDDDPDYPAITAYALDAGSFPFYGSCWVKGYATGLGNITLFFPINYKDGYIGTDNAGRLFNVSNNTWSGVLYDASGTSYTVNFGSFNLPTYRRYSGSSYSNVTLYLTPEDGNILFPDSPGPVYTVADVLPYLSILLLGGVFLCCMRRS